MGKMSNLDLERKESEMDADELRSFRNAKWRMNLVSCVCTMLQMLNSDTRKKIHREYGEKLCKDLEFSLNEIWHEMGRKADENKDEPSA